MSARVHHSLLDGLGRDREGRAQDARGLRGRVPLGLQRGVRLLSLTRLAEDIEKLVKHR